MVRTSRAGTEVTVFNEHEEVARDIQRIALVRPALIEALRFRARSLDERANLLRALYGSRMLRAYDRARAELELDIDAVPMAKARAYEARAAELEARVSALEAAIGVVHRRLRRRKTWERAPSALFPARVVDRRLRRRKTQSRRSRMRSSASRFA